MLERAIGQMARNVYQPHLTKVNGFGAQLETVKFCRNIEAQLGDAMRVGAIYGPLVGDLGDEAPPVLKPLDYDLSWAA